MNLRTAADFQARRVTNPDQSEVFRNSLYDFQLYATAGVTQMQFFTYPQGQGTTSALGATVGTTKTKADTNLTVANTLPSGMSFMIESIEVMFWPGSVPTASTYTPANIAVFNATATAALIGSSNDVNTFYQSGTLTLTVLQKDYLTESPLQKFPPKTWVGGDYAVASNAAVATGAIGQSASRASGRAYYLEPEITLLPAQNFGVSLTWPGAVATPSGFNARVGVVLDGVFLRASQ